MATSTGPNIESGRRAVEALMDDTAMVLVEPTDPRTWPMDPITGQLTPPADTVVYDGRAKLKPDTQGRIPVEEGVLTYATADYTFGAPIHECPELLPGMRILMTSSRRDPGLPGQIFEVVQPIFGTLAVQRKVQVRWERQVV